jgi:hypothetical protein
VLPPRGQISFRPISTSKSFKLEQENEVKKVTERPRVLAHLRFLGALPGEGGFLEPNTFESSLVSQMVSQNAITKKLN